MASEKAGFDIEKLATPPFVHDATLPPITDDIAPGAKQGVVIVVVGPLPSVVSSIVFDPDLGYAVWGTAPQTGAPVTVDDGSGGFEILFDEDGEVIYA